MKNVFHTQACCKLFQQVVTSLQMTNRNKPDLNRLCYNLMKLTNAYNLLTSCNESVKLTTCNKPVRVSAQVCCRFVALQSSSRYQDAFASLAPA